MNFPGLDPLWRGTHKTAQALYAIRPWTISHCRAAIAAGDSVVVVATTALGDSILCTPLIQALSDELSPDRVGFLVREPYASLYEKDPRIGRLYTVGGKYRNFCRLRHQFLANNNPPRIALIANCTEPDLIPWLWHCGVRGFLRYRTRWSEWPEWFANKEMLRRPGTPEYATGHAIENNLAMASTLGIPTIERLLKTYPPSVPAEFCPAAERENTVIIHPGASRVEKRWPLESWTAVLYRLNRDFGCRVTISGSAAEYDEAEKLRRRLMPGVPTENLAGKLSLPELAARQHRASLFLSGDTGPYHLAVSVGCPTVTLFAPKDRGSSIEACGPHKADPQFHRTRQTSRFELKLSTIFPETVIEESSAILAALAQARQPADSTPAA
jgi:heptosyltransferase I